MNGITAINRNINNFRAITWNTNGARWDVVSLLMLQADIIAIQEAGSLRSISGRPDGSGSQLQCPPQQGRPDISFGDFVDIDNLGITEHIWESGNGRFYLYYYDRNVDGNDQETPKQNIAIVSRERAHEIIILPLEMRDNAPGNRMFINRPALGIRIENSIFFTIHPEPHMGRNEASTLINGIQTYVTEYDTALPTWMIMGDFNNIPNQIQNLNDIQGIERRLLSQDYATHHRSVLDYAFAGGPVHLANILAGLFARRIDNLHGSDHYPIQFF